jgi:hypothetical protein
MLSIDKHMTAQKTIEKRLTKTSGELLLGIQRYERPSGAVNMRVPCSVYRMRKNVN